MSAPDPVTADLRITEPTDDELRTTAVTTTARLLLRHWPQQEEEQAYRDAAHLLDRFIQATTRRAVLLIPGSRDDCYRLADAVRRTGSNDCAVCPGRVAPYSGQPGEQDLRAAREVLDVLFRAVG